MADEVTLGRNANARAPQSVVIGSLAASGDSSGGDVVIGDRASVAANASDAVAIGQLASVTASNGVAVGNSAAAAASSVAVGKEALATGIASHVIGQGSTASAAYGVTIGYSNTNPVTAGVVIGQNSSIASGEPYAVVIGQNAVADATGGATGGYQVVIGRDAKGEAWRGIAIGGFAEAQAVSATAVGYGALAQAAHSVALGKAAFAPFVGSIVIGDQLTDIWFGNGHTSRYVDFEGSTISRTPSDNPTVIHGTDARDTTASPVNNVAGGSLRLVGGRGTGNAAPGPVEFYVSTPGASSNDQQAATLVAKVDHSATANSTRFWLWDTTAGSLKQVMLGAADSGGSGFKMLRVAN